MTTDLIRQLSLSTVGELLGRDEFSMPDGLIRAARRAKWNLPVTIFGLMRSEGLALSPGALDELSRHGFRVAAYAEVMSAAADASAMRVCKGPSIAQKYPSGIVRHAGDLDLAFYREEDLWLAAQRIISRFPIHDVALNFYGAHGHIAIALRWPADEFLLDPEFSVDLISSPFAGDGSAVPSRPLPVRALSERDFDALCLAEEGFQRPFGLTDIMDSLVIFDEELPASLLAAAEEYQLAPELLELLRAGAGVSDRLLHLSQTKELESLAAVEASRRERATAASGVEPSSDWATHLEDEGNWSCISLDADSTSSTVSTKKLSRGYLVETPIGLFIAVNGDTYDADLVVEARAAVR